MNKRLTKEELKRIPQDHKLPVTRRQFLAHGLVEGMGFLVMPSVIDMLLRPSYVYGEECPVKDALAVNQMGFIVIDCSGGTKLTSNGLPLNEGKQLLGSYSTLSIPDGSLNPDARFGLNMQANSPMFTAMTTTMSAATQAKVKGGVIAYQSGDDTGNNPQNPMGFVNLANQVGTAAKAKYFVNGLGTRASASGGNSAPALTASAPPLPVQNATSVLGAVGLNIAGLSDPQKSALLKWASSLTSSQVNKLRGMTNGQQLAVAVDCGAKGNRDLVGQGALVDARQDPIMQTVFNINANSNNNDAREAAVAYQVLKGHALCATIERGGGDNHGQGPTVAANYEGGVGTLVGRLLEAANQLKTGLCIAVITDGGQSCAAGATSGSSDAGDRGGALFFAIRGQDGATPIQLVNQGMAGFYTEAQAASRATYIGASPQRAAVVLFANWLSTQGRLGQLGSIVDRGIFDPAMVAPFIVVA